jgi:TRAP-type mannitol/chloroaromatic compound transport system substrate-binding protein
MNLEHATRLSRRRFLTLATTTVAAGALTSHLLRPRKSSLHLRLGAPYSSPYLVQFIKDIQERSQGEIRFTLIVDPGRADISDALHRGEWDFAAHVPALNLVKHPAIGFFGTLPSRMSAARKTEWLASESTLAHWDRLYAPLGLKPLFFGCDSFDFGQFSSRPIESLSDLKGLKIRAPRDARSKWFKDVGLEPVYQQFSNHPVTLFQKRRLDLSESLSHTWNYERRRDFMIPNHPPIHYYANRWMRSGSANELLVANKTWLNFSKDIQNLVSAVSHEIGQGISRQRTQSEKLSWQKMLADSDGRATDFPVEMNQIFEAKGQLLREKVARTDNLAQDIYRSYLSFES